MEDDAKITEGYNLIIACHNSYLHDILNKQVYLKDCRNTL